MVGAEQLCPQAISAKRRRSVALTLHELLDEYAKGHIAAVILILAESQYQDSFVVDKELHMMSTIVKLLNELK